MVHEGLDFLYKKVDELGLKYIPTQTNFFLIDVQQDGKGLFEKMLRRGVIVRAMNAYGYPTHIRVTVGLPEENRRFIVALKEVL